MGARRRAEIAGAGFAGLAAAIALAQRGWSVRIHEANTELRELGAGLFVWDNGLATLDALGVLDEVLRSSVAPPASEIRVDGERQSLQPANTPGTFAMRTMTRQALYSAVLAGARRHGVRILTDSRVTGASEAGELILEDGQRLAADLVIGADGVRSCVRDSLPIAKQRVGYDKGIFRFLVDRDGVRGGDWDNVIDFWTHVPATRRILYVPCNDETAYLAVMASTSDEQGAQMPFDKALWSSSFPMLAPLIARAEGVGRFDTYQATRIAAWHFGKVALIGDAAQAMPPTLGQGAGVAMMNALALAVALDEGGPVPEALDAWEARERPFTDHTQARAEELAAMGADRSSLPKREVGLHAAQHLPSGTRHPAPATLDAHVSELASTAWYRAAWSLVLQRHHGKLDKLGRPAEEHFIRVANRLLTMFPQANPAQVQAALLHDALEPGALTDQELREAGIAERAVDMIRRISLPQDGRSYLQYAKDLAASGDVEAVAVKLADNADALDLFGAIGTAEAKERIEKQYLPSRAALRAGLPDRLQRAVEQ
jgi:2-methyl-3-hydroxypyridine 5-carboxylic acid dioxygenase